MKTVDWKTEMRSVPPQVSDAVPEHGIQQSSSLTGVDVDARVLAQ